MEHIQHQSPEMAALSSRTSKPLYEPPTVTVMTDEEVLTAFQITPAAVTWWGAM
ncbi:MAG: hypothetical protein AB7N91_11955 [Candidatus Tectimicrobiota bacterium]